jgi:hypothetical protein
MRDAGDTYWIATAAGPLIESRHLDEAGEVGLMRPSRQYVKGRGPTGNTALRDLVYELVRMVVV